MPPPPPPAPGKSPAGPFTLSDAQHTAALLEASGWHEIAHTSHELIVTVDLDAIVDDEALGFFGVPTELFSAAWEAINRQVAPLRRDDGLVDATLAFQVFTATA